MADHDLNNVQVFDSSGSFKFAFDGTKGGGSHFSGFFHGIAVDDKSGNIYVTNDSVNKVQVFASNGSFKFAFDGTKGGGSLFSAPEKITVDASGDIYVTDSSLVQVFDPNGSFKFAFDGIKGGGSSFQASAGITVDESGNIYVTDRQLLKVQVFDSTGSFKVAFLPSDTTYRLEGFPFSLGGIVVDGSGNMYVATIDAVYNSDDTISTIRVFDPVNRLSKVYFDYSRSGWGSFTEIAIDVSGNIYVANGILNTVQVFDSKHVLKFSFDGT